MKKILILVLSIFISLGLLSVKAEDKKVAAPGLDTVFNWIDLNDSFQDEKGYHGIRKANEGDLYSNGIGIKQQFNVTNNNKVEIEFQIPDYNHSDRTLKEGHVSATKPYDIYLVNVDTGFSSIFRIWSDNTTIDPEKTSSYLQYCESKTSGWETYSGGFISGVFTDESSFKIRYDSENYFSVYRDWEDAYTPFHNLGDLGAKEAQYLAFMEENYKNATTIEIWFAHQSLEANTANEVVIKSINGQSFLVDEDNNIVDNVSPLVANINTSLVDSKATKNTEYTLRIEKFFNDPNTTTDFYVRPTVDPALSQDELVENTKLKVKHSTESEYTYVGEVDVEASLIKKIVFPKEGQYELVLEVGDLAGNIGLSNTLVINVVKGYDIVLNGEIVATGKTNSTITLPTATATDENGVERAVSIKVEDPIGSLVEVKDNKFTPTSVGIYYVTYSSEYEDELGVIHKSSKIEREIIVSKGNEQVEPGDTEDPENNNSVLLWILIPSAVVVAGGVTTTLILIKKKKK